MTDLDELTKVFTEKLASTGSLDKAFLKAVWIAYKAGYADGRATPEVELAQPKWAMEDRAQCLQDV